MSKVDVPKPLAMFYTLFRLKPPAWDAQIDPLFQALRVWTEIGEMSESDSFGTSCSVDFVRLLTSFQ
jgi:hypothetical protein